ncbi:DUF4474 domain-containing protein [Konateibacter massiliensis]|uniref:DUF4474 domain-containing protein n=1 Tax=Konateibacter massiliensis TaxID=2002841 RepID=UPI0015D4AC09|nr:DUF4474 domain-containing protein [Konateibacter massiliensis]
MTIWYIMSTCIFFILSFGIAILLRVKKKKPSSSPDALPEESAVLNVIRDSTGFFYSQKHDFFHSSKEAPQYQFGCCQLYDDTMPLIGMIVDCEPITFDFDNRHWLIEFWKGQYLAATGCQIGIYSTEHEAIKAPGFQGMFYKSLSDEQCRIVSYTLKRKNKVLFHESPGFCFASGLKPGRYSSPSALALKVKLTFLNKKLLLAFIGGLKAAGYSKNEYSYHFKTVTVHFTKPHTTQPASRTRVQEAIIRQANYASCLKFTQLTANLSGVPKKLEAISNLDKELYEKVMKSLYSKDLYSGYELISPILRKLEEYTATEAVSPQEISDT